MSNARAIRDGIAERLPQLPFFRTFTVRTSRAYQVQPTDLPYLGIYLMGEGLASDGDPNAGEPKFKYESIIGISVMLKNIDADELEVALDTAYDVVMIGLLTDPSFMGFQTEYAIEGVSKGTREFTYGPLGSTNETPIGELQLQLTFITRYDYPPEIVDDLRIVHLETVYPSVAEAPYVQQIVAEWDLAIGSTVQLGMAGFNGRATLFADATVIT